MKPAVWCRQPSPVVLRTVTAAAGAAASGGGAAFGVADATLPVASSAVSSLTLSIFWSHQPKRWTNTIDSFVLWVLYYGCICVIIALSADPSSRLCRVRRCACVRPTMFCCCCFCCFFFNSFIHMQYVRIRVVYRYVVCVVYVCSLLLTVSRHEYETNVRWGCSWRINTAQRLILLCDCWTLASNCDSQTMQKTK